eukprot:TRINITY_DN9439_c0_g1_i1.p1 TRINITY_DN9439_c0_g1~~TRINITY_DN9439_c0_g1_i1.p1  ORF type:complete len:162 (+),score=23.98 TRINITY_DN9439_c0_g1_i1:149-634(+)
MLVVRVPSGQVPQYIVVSRGKSQPSGGKAPLSLSPRQLMLVNSLRFPISVGRVPVKPTFVCNSKEVILVNFPNSLGSVPVAEIDERGKVPWRFVKRPKEVEMVPRGLDEKSIPVKLVSPAHCVGMIPLTLVCFKVKVTRLESSPHSEGKGPLSLIPAKLNV